MEMEKDKLKSFIDDNRDAFDDEMPSLKVWDKIEEALPHDRGRFVPIRWLWTLGAAAAMVVLLLGAYVFTMNQSDDVQVAESEQPVFRLSNVSEEMAEVNERIDEMKKFPEGEEYLSAVEELRSEYESLCIELGRGADRGKIIEAMIQNYRMRLEILEEMLEELRKWHNETEDASYEV
jgi:hypothetical protein